MKQPRIEFLVCLVIYTLVVRVLPYILMNADIKTDPTVLYYPWNFSPLTAVCLFCGAYLPLRRLAFLVPLGILFLSDLGILALSGHLDWAFPPHRWMLTYLCFSLAAALGFLLRSGQPRQVRAGALGLGLGFEAMFFVASNFLVWYVTSRMPEPMYPDTLAGLGQCYVVGLPFFGKSLLGTTAFTLLLFSPVGIRAAMTPTGEREQGRKPSELAPVRVK